MPVVHSTRSWKGNTHLQKPFGYVKGMKTIVILRHSNRSMRLNGIRSKWSGGHLNFGVHQYLNKEFEYLTFVRNPINRIVSFYNFVSRTQGHRLHESATNLSLTEFLNSVDDPDISNGQISRISGIRGTEDEMIRTANAQHRTALHIHRSRRAF